MLLNTWGLLNTWEEVAEAGEVVGAADVLVGGAAAGWNHGARAQRKRDRIRKDDEEFLEIIKLAMPEILKHLQ